MPQADTTASFGYWVRRRRLALDMTQAVLARAVGCATVTISKIERDERRPSQQMAELLAEHLAIPEEERDSFLDIALGKQAVHRIAMTDEPVLGVPSPTGDPPASNLPSPLTPFIGRRAELTQLMALLEDPACRLLTLAGPGGFGKTRLAIRLGDVGLERSDLFPDGVFFVELAELANPSLVIPAIAAALDFTFFSQTEQERQLLGFLANRRLLLILDNAEETLHATYLEGILARASGVKLLVTSRKALKLRHEWFYPVRGMRTAAAENRSDDSAGDVRTDAVALFQQCAQRARTDFDLARELPHVQRICALVDGAPLAIELAAAWVRALPCAQVAQELARSMDLLTTTLTDLPARHRSMHAVLVQSWRYLTAEEQMIFRRLSVFMGGFQPDAAATVVNAPFSVLASLVDKSMLQLTQQGRYRIHALLHQLGREELATDSEVESVYERHSRHYLGVVADRGKTIDGPDQLRVLREFQDDLDNISNAWFFAVEHTLLEELAEAVHCLFRFLWLRNRFEEGMEFAERALESLDRADIPPKLQPMHVELMAYAAQFAATSGAYHEALVMLDMAFAEALATGILQGQFHCHYVRGLVYDQLGEGDLAVDALRAAYELARELDNDRYRAETALRLGYTIYNLKGDFAASVELVEESLALLPRLGDQSNLAEALDHIAWMRWIAGRVDEAEELYKESVDLARAIGNRLVEGRAVGGLGLMAWTRGDWDPAIALMHQRLSIMEEIGHENLVKRSVNLLCGIYTHAGRYEDALELLEQFPEIWYTPWTAEAQIHMGEFIEVMAYLPQESAATLASGHVNDLSRYSVAWVMLLRSDCPLARPGDEHGQVALTRAERIVYAADLLQALRVHAYCEPTTRNRVEQLWTELASKPVFQSYAQSHESEPKRSLEDIVAELLDIRLG